MIQQLIKLHSLICLLVGIYTTLSQILKVNISRVLFSFGFPVIRCVTNSLNNVYAIPMPIFPRYIGPKGLICESAMCAEKAAQ